MFGHTLSESVTEWGQTLHCLQVSGPPTNQVWGKDVTLTRSDTSTSRTSAILPLPARNILVASLRIIQVCTDGYESSVQTILARDRARSYHPSHAVPRGNSGLSRQRGKYNTVEPLWQHLVPGFAASAVLKPAIVSMMDAIVL